MAGTIVIHPGALGDVLLAIPALRALRAGGPVTLAAEPRIGALLRVLDVVDDAVSPEALGLGALFIDEPGDAEVPLLSRAARVVSWFGARDPVFVRRLQASVAGATVAPSVPTDGLVWRHLCESIGASALGDAGPLSVPSRIIREGEGLLRESGWDGSAPVALLHPGAGSATKQWPAAGFAALHRHLTSDRGYTVIVHQGPADRGAVEGLKDALDVRANLVVEPPLEALAGALARTALYVGNDSGVSHLAASVYVPRVVVLSRPDLSRWRPWSRAARIVCVTMHGLNPGDLSAVLDAVSDA